MSSLKSPKCNCYYLTRLALKSLKKKHSVSLFKTPKKNDSFMNYKVPKTIFVIPLIHKQPNIFSDRVCYFEEVAKKKSSLPPPSKLLRINFVDKYKKHEDWVTPNKDKKHFEGAKRTTLIDEIIKRSKQIPGPMDYSIRHKIRIKGVYHSKTEKHG